MTRINTIEPSALTDQHLMAEYRELPRVFALTVRARSFKAPVCYTMGAGHVTFFYTRTDWLSRRQSAIIAELLDRGYQLTHREAPAPIGPPSGWEPDERDREVNLVRLRERLRAAPREGFYTYRGVPVGMDFYDRVKP